MASLLTTIYEQADNPQAAAKHAMDKFKNDPAKAHKHAMFLANVSKNRHPESSKKWLAAAEIINKQIAAPLDKGDASQPQTSVDRLRKNRDQEKSVLKSLVRSLSTASKLSKPELTSDHKSSIEKMMKDDADNSPYSQDNLDRAWKYSKKLGVDMERVISHMKVVNPSLDFGDRDI